MRREVYKRYMRDVGGTYEWRIVWVWGANEGGDARYMGGVCGLRWAHVGSAYVGFDCSLYGDCMNDIKFK